MALQEQQPEVPDVPLQKAYMKGRSAGVQRAEKAAAAEWRALTPAEREAAARQGGYKAVYKAIWEGKVRGSAGNKTYPQNSANSGTALNCHSSSVA